MTGRSDNTVVIVGAGLAGVQTALQLRARGGDMPIVLLGDEATAYDRPPLSKEVLAGEREPRGLLLLGEEATRVERIDHRALTAALAIDREARTVTLSDGTALPYGHLVLATGGEASTLTFLPVDNDKVFVLRSIEDAHGLSDRLVEGRRLLVVGGGWLGLETAAAARKRGVHVTLVEQAQRLCARSVPPEVSQYLDDVHRAEGVDLRLGRPCRATVTADGVWLDDGERERFDLCLVAIGMRARDRLAREAGLPCEDGVATDEHGRTADPNIFAVGDVAASWRPALGRRLRLESWKSASLQARTAAAAILGQHDTDAEAPWFWSDQNGKLLQASGLPDAADALISFEPGDRPLWRYGRGGEVRFVVGVNRARDLREAHRALSEQWRRAAATLLAAAS